MINFYHRFIPNASTTLHPLYCALKGKPQNQCLVSSNDMMNAYPFAITSLTSATLLAHPRFGVPIAMTSDASDSGIGAVFEQFVEGAWQPLAFLATNSVNQNASTVHLCRELITLFLAIRHFSFLLEGRVFSTLTSHDGSAKNVRSLDATSAKTASFIFEFSTDITHLAGKDNYVADCLSRSFVSNVALGVDYPAMDAA